MECVECGLLCFKGTWNTQTETLCLHGDLWRYDPKSGVSPKHWLEKVASIPDSFPCWVRSNEVTHGLVSQSWPSLRHCSKWESIKEEQHIWYESSNFQTPFRQFRNILQTPTKQSPMFRHVWTIHLLEARCGLFLSSFFLLLLPWENKVNSYSNQVKLSWVCKLEWSSTIET